MAFLDAFKRRIQTTPGWAGGSLKDEIARLNQPQIPQTGGVAFAQPQSPTTMAVNPDQPFTRPRTVNPIPVDQQADPTATRQRAVSFDTVTGRPNEDFYRANPDQTAGAVDLNKAYQNWEPRGAKRGFKNSLKTGLMYASEAVKNNPQDPVTALIAGFGTGAIGGTAAPNFKNRLTRQWKVAQTGQAAQQQLGMAKEQAQIDSMGETPVKLPDGSIVMAPRKTAASVALRSLGEGRLQDSAKARIDNWKSMRAEQRKARIVREYTQGMLNDPESLEYAAEELGIPGNLREKFISGKMKRELNEKGEIILVDQQTGKTTNTGTTSYDVTKEGGRNKRSAAQIAAADRRTLAENSRFYAGLKQREASDIRNRDDRVSRVAGEYAYNMDIANDPSTPKEEKAAAEARAKATRKMLETSGLYDIDDQGNATPKAPTAQTGTPNDKPKYAGKVITEGNLKRYAADHEISVDEARKVFEGATVVP